MCWKHVRTTSRKGGFLIVTFLLYRVGDPSSDSKIQGDPFKTIFVGRIVSDSAVLLFNWLDLANLRGHVP